MRDAGSFSTGGEGVVVYTQTLAKYPEDPDTQE